MLANGTDQGKNSSCHNKTANDQIGWNNVSIKVVEKFTIKNRHQHNGKKAGYLVNLVSSCNRSNLKLAYQDTVLKTEL